MVRVEPPPVVAAGRLTTPVEDRITALLGTALVGGVLADAWAHTNLLSTIESFFTPWHALLYGGFAATAAWTVALAYRRRAGVPLWWRDGWPAGYGLGAVGVLLFLAGGIGDLIWHEIFGIETGLDGGLSPTHVAVDLGGVLLLTSPLRSWWAADSASARSERSEPRSRERKAGSASARSERSEPRSRERKADPERRRAASGLLSIALGTTMLSALLLNFVALMTVAPTLPYRLAAPEHDTAVRGVQSYLVATVLLLVPVLLCHRRRATPGTATAVVGVVSLFAMVMYEFPMPQAAAALAATLGAALADVILVRLDAVRGEDAPLRLPVAGATVATLVWSAHLLGIQVAAGIAWPVELWAGTVLFTALTGWFLGLLSRG